MKNVISTIKAVVVMAIVAALCNMVTGSDDLVKTIMEEGNAIFGSAFVLLFPFMFVFDMLEDKLEKKGIDSFNVFMVAVAIMGTVVFGCLQVAEYEAHQDSLTWEEVGEFKGSVLCTMGGYAEDEDGTVYVIKDMDRSAFSSIYNQMRRAEGLDRTAAYAKACSLADNGKIVACEEQSERDYKVVSREDGKQVLLSRPAQHNNK